MSGALTALGLCAGLLLTSCSSPSELPQDTTPPTTSAPGPGSSASADPETDTAGEKFGNQLIERDAFFKDQQLPLDGTPLVAVTKEQQEFIARERAFLESNGVAWGGAEQESIYLALAADACETAILNGHEIDKDLLITHVQSSPIFAGLIPAELTGAEHTAAERNVASIMVAGTGYLCKQDAAQWMEAFEATYPPA